MDVALAGPLTGKVSGNLQHFHAAPWSDGDAGEFGFGGADRGAGDGDDLLAADLGNVLRAGGGDKHAGQQGRQGDGKQSKGLDHWLHLIPSMGVQLYCWEQASARGATDCRQEKAYSSSGTILRHRGGHSTARAGIGM